MPPKLWIVIGVVIVVAAVIAVSVGSIARARAQSDVAEAKWQAAEAEMESIRRQILQYCLEHDFEYPSGLADLTPDYLPVLPQDPFTGQPYWYVPSESGFTLTCLGADGTAGGQDIPDRDIIFDEKGERP